MAPDPRPRSQDGFSAVAYWIERADLSDLPVVEAALGKIIDGSWLTDCAWLDDVTNPLAVVMLLDNGLVIRWRQLTEYPDYFRVTYVGPLDEF